MMKVKRTHFHAVEKIQAWAQFGGGHGGRFPPLFQMGGT